jgi:hypothetical protein
MVVELIYQIIFVQCVHVDRGDESIFPCNHCVRLNKPDGYCYHTEELCYEDIISIVNNYNDPLNNNKYTKRFIKHPEADERRNKKLMKSFLINVYYMKLEEIESLNIDTLVLKYKELRQLYNVNKDSIKDMKDKTIEDLLIIYGIDTIDLYNDVIIEIIESNKFKNFNNIENNSIEQKRIIILYLHYSGRIIENCLMKYSIMNSIDKPPMLKEPEKCIMCTLHFKLRIGELLMTSLSTDILLFM